MGDEAGPRKSSLTKSRRSQSLVSWVAVPCLGAATTTAVGFLMLVLTGAGS